MSVPSNRFALIVAKRYFSAKGTCFSAIIFEATADGVQKYVVEPFIESYDPCRKTVYKRLRRLGYFKDYELRDVECHEYFVDRIALLQNHIDARKGADAVIGSAPDEEKYFRRHGVIYEW